MLHISMSEPLPTEKMPESAPVALKGRYELRAVLGEGGMGRVHRGFDRVLGRPVAIKILTDLDSPMMIQRFEREAQILSQLNHPNLAAVYDFGVEGTQPFTVMEFIDGKSLGRLIEESGGIEPEKALPMIAQIGEGLAAAHDRGVVHRDIKPENILVCRKSDKDWVEIVDFGLAISDVHVKTDDRLTVPGYVVGTQRYMSPEQMEGKPPTIATDIYAFGLVCAEMLAGPENVKAGRLRSTVPVKAAITKYWSIIEKACHEEPAERWPTARAMIHAFQQVATTTMAPVEKEEMLRHRSKVVLRIRRKKRFMALFTVGAVLMSLVTTGVFLWRDTHERGNEIPVIAIEGVAVNWLSRNELQVRLTGEIQKSQPQRMTLEVVLCDANGNRLPGKNSHLEDQALGSLHYLDVLASPQRFERILPPLQVPTSIRKGYASVTVFDHNKLLIAQQNSAFWSERQ